MGMVSDILVIIIIVILVNSFHPIEELRSTFHLYKYGYNIQSKRSQVKVAIFVMKADHLFNNII